MEEWKEYKLGEITNMKNGKKRPQSNGVFPVYGGNGIMDYSDSYNAENAIIVGRVGAYCGCVYKCDGKCWVSDNAISVFAKDIVDTQFLYYLMTTVDFHHHHIGGAQPLMTQDIIGDFTVSIPPLSVQNQIVHILKSFDDKIEVNRQINDNLEQQAQALFKSWFVDFEPFRDGEFVDSELGMIPKGWAVNKLNEICHNITDGVHNTVKDDIDGSYYLLSAKNIKRGLLEISKNDRKINKETFEKLRRRTKLEKGDILLTSVGTIGELLLLKSAPANYEFQRSVAIIKPNKDIVNSSYIYESLKARINDVKNLAHGAVQQCIFIGDLKDFKLIVAPNCLIQKFNELVSNLYEIIESINDESFHLAELRDTLLPRLMSGELKVNDVEI